MFHLLLQPLRRQPIDKLPNVENCKITNIPTIIHSRSRCVRRSKNAFTFALLLLIQMRGMSSILLAVIGSEVFVFNDVESLDQEPLRIII